MEEPTNPKEALAATQRKQEEADYWDDRVDRLIESLRNIQKENGFAPRMELAYRRSR